MSLNPRETTLNFAATGGTPLKSVRAVQEPICCIPYIMSTAANYYGSGEPVMNEQNGILQIIVNPDSTKEYWLYLLCSKSLLKEDFIIRIGQNVAPTVLEETYLNYVAYRCTIPAKGEGNWWKIFYKGSQYCEVKLYAS